MDSLLLFMVFLIFEVHFLKHRNTYRPCFLQMQTTSWSTTLYKELQSKLLGKKKVCIYIYIYIYIYIREGDGTPLQYSCLENPMDGGAWWAAVHGVTKSWTRLSNFTFTFHFHALEKEMATHSSALAWRIPGTGGVWWAPVYRVTQSRTRLKRLSLYIYIYIYIY